MSHESTTDNPYTRAIAEFVSGLTYEAIPEHVRHRVKLLMLDSLGCALYGADLEWCRMIQDSLGSVDTTRECVVWGTKKKLSAPHAALANGTAVQGFELDDVHRAGVLHVGAVVIPALLPIAERKAGMSGKEFLTAAVAGYEIGPRVGLCMGPAHIASGWHSGATLGVFSSAAGAARGLKLDTDKTVHALGIAGTQAAGLMAAQFGAMVKRMHAGRSSQSGLYGALFAEAGFTGIVNVLESEYGGFCTAMSQSKDQFDLKELTAGFGSTWQTMGVALKFYSCVGSNHTTLDAIREMQAEKPFGAKDVKKIVVHGSKVTMEHVGWKYVPQGLTSAQLNLPYCVATWLIEGDCFVDQFTEDKVADPARMALAGKVEVHEDKAITAKGAKFRHVVHAEAHLNDGTVLKRTVESGRGSEQKFASDSDIVEKFEKLAAKALPKAQVGRLRDAMLGLEKLEDAAELARLLARA
ncbi:MAG TPA: MmgE/PrpD family protein [Burkholderiales bacterium]|jgi:2-methylcitrate dehydratase PrpD|nr:MmgE/PrpD family protein [Burkholderiales bacterium]